MEFRHLRIGLPTWNSLPIALCSLHLTLPHSSINWRPISSSRDSEIFSTSCGTAVTVKWFWWCLLMCQLTYLFLTLVACYNFFQLLLVTILVKLQLFCCQMSPPISRTVTIFICITGIYNILSSEDVLFWAKATGNILILVECTLMDINANLIVLFWPNSAFLIATTTLRLNSHQVVGLISHFYSLDSAWHQIALLVPEFEVRI